MMTPTEMAIMKLAGIIGLYFAVYLSLQGVNDSRTAVQAIRVAIAGALVVLALRELYQVAVILLRGVSIL